MTLEMMGFYENIFTDSPPAQSMSGPFAHVINSLTGIDSLVSKYGTVVYAQEVLVPELLEMLVQEDMVVDTKEARQILKESNKIGDLLNRE
ncbi:hypothetical protein EMCG_00405 [[Emmonsia] crescens]|uniref:Restriction of telomere capping protein 4 n=1 Tax=[Emmonsia] crescens TaxID=73230 RepID=A0A0G2J8J3_9EURO|nr:hypothetical protein EMCG_00405 [Emmonsia crescens UAMH 3008]